jgi:peptide/nickel transport system ATP-binding protein
MERCKVERPVLREVAPGQKSACHLNDALSNIRSDGLI